MTGSETFTPGQAASLTLLRYGCDDCGYWWYEWLGGQPTQSNCPVPDCDCGEVVVDFEALLPRGAPSPGNIVMHSSGAARIEPHKHGRHRLEQLWAAFQQRHPHHVARFAGRYATIKSIGARFVGPEKADASPKAKVGRNDPCPCGSGRKYKKCCGASPA